MPDDSRVEDAPTTGPTAASGPDSPAEAGEAPAKKATARKTGTRKTAAKKATADTPPDDTPAGESAPREGTAPEAPVKKAAAKRTRKSAAKKTAVADGDAMQPAAGTPQVAADGTPAPVSEATAADEGSTGEAPARKTARASTAKRAPRKTAKKAADQPPATEADAADAVTAPAAPAEAGDNGAMPLFQAPEPVKAPARRTRKTAAKRVAPVVAEAVPAEEEEAEGAEAPEAVVPAAAPEAAEAPETADEVADDEAEGQPGDRTEDQTEDEGEGDDQTDGGARRRRRRGGRRRRKSGEGGETADQGDTGDAGDAVEAGDSGETGQGRQSGAEQDAQTEEGSSRRRRRRRRSGDDSGENGEDQGTPAPRARKSRSAEDEITAVSGSTRLEAKKQRRREGREAGRRRAPIVSEAEFLARRESVERVMVIRQREDLTQIGVLEDKVLVEHYVARESQTSIIGNVYLGRVQNVLPSMEAAFVDIGKGRNAVLYAGEVNWSSLGHKDGQPRKIESVLSSGQSILVQVTKDPIGHKGARLTSQISLAGRFLVYVPDGTTSGISRKLPDTERNRLKSLLKEIVPESAGVIVRTAAEGASEDELTRDVERLKARWEDIEKKSKGGAPQLLYGEPDLTLKVVRDLFTEDFAKLVIEGADAWETVQGYVEHVAPDLADRLERFTPGENGKDVFAAYRIDEQIAKALDRKVWLPSGGSLVIDRTEAMTVIDVNTGKFTGSGGNLEETVTKNNLEAAEEVVRQLRLRDIGGIIVVDFIDMVLESNRDLVLRRMVECLGRDRTRHQVAEVTSLGLVQMTRKRIGTGLLEAFGENCEHCHGRGVIVRDQPVEPKRSEEDSQGGKGGRRRGRGRGGDEGDGDGRTPAAKPLVPPSPKLVAAMARPEHRHDSGSDHDAAAPAAATPAEVGDRVAGQVAGQVAQPVVETVTEVVAEAVTEAVSAAADVAVAPGGDPATGPGTDAAAGPSGDIAAGPAADTATGPAPKVVTRTRRRSASRPAGQPASTTAPVQPIVVEPVAVPSAPSAPTEAVVATEPPRVVTRTRGRSATRPAGPPADAPQHAVVGSDGVGTSGDADAPTDPEAPVIEHVPVKKKGTRKR